MQGVGINYIVVLIAAIASMIVGALWYSPLLFGNLWAKLSNFSKSDMEKAKKKGMGSSYFMAFIGSLVTAFVLAAFINLAGAESLRVALEIAFWLWLGFIATTTLSSVLWEGKPVKLYMLNNAHNLVSILIMAAIIASF